PTWFDEGVAMQQEKARRWGADRDVQKAITNGVFIPLPELDRMRIYADSPAQRIELFYVESASIVSFLIQEEGRFRFLSLCRNLQGGNDFHHAFELAYPHYKTLERLNEAWVDYLERK
ncbi:MAG TPA: hypothetical protein VLJ10_04900, partial [Candidatus Bathyarchaeia archaeon]|nr:hypothetical protein [Candidatus Bathyarchaeia archaeon]